MIDTLASPLTYRAKSTDHMLWIEGGTFRMGSDRHYPEEAPVHRVTVDGFWMDRTPVTNRQFSQFVRATGHVTFAAAGLGGAPGVGSARGDRKRRT